MPWVNVVTTRELTEANFRTLNAGITASLVVYAGKKEQGVYVSVTRPQTLFWGQEQRDDSAIFEVRWIGEFDLEVKQRITAAFSTDLAASVGFDPDRVRVLFTSFTSEDWGRSRGEYS